MRTNATAAETAVTDKLAREIAIQAELLALNCAMEERRGTGETSEALLALSRDLRQATGRQTGLMARRSSPVARRS
jgi:hypothetical protein